MNTLRNRLLASYLAILLIMLGLIGVALLVFLRTRPLPTDSIVRDLTATLLDVRVSEDWSFDTGTDAAQTNPDDTLSFATIRLRVVAYLETQAEERDVRTLVVDGNGVVRFDSDQSLSEGDTLNELERSPVASVARPRVSEVYQGKFEDPNGSEWVFVAQPFRPMLTFLRDMQQMRRPNAAAPTSELFVMVAQPVPRSSLREVFRQFGTAMFAPLLQAGLVGLIIALGLAVLIARSVARPLQDMSRAAHRIAQGDFRQPVPVQGPQEVRTLAQSLNDMMGRVAVSQQAQRDFLANVSHDLRTPLTSIQGFSQAIAEGVTSDPESAQHAAQVIHDEAARMHRMVESLLDLARIEAGQLDMLRHTVRVGDMVQAVGDSLSVKAREKGLRLETQIPPDLPRIAGDGDRLAQVFTNLIDNAIKHTPAGGRVGLQAGVSDGGVVVTVRDNGEGIPPEDLPRIFERFYQVDKSRRSGMGLGLAITRQIVEAHGGTIHVASALGSGTVFTVWLPLPAPDMTTVSARRS